MKSVITITVVLLAALVCAAGCTGTGTGQAGTSSSAPASTPVSAPPGQGAAPAATTAGAAGGPAPVWITVTPTVRMFDTSGAVNISVRKRVADPVMIVITFNGGTQAGNIERIDIANQNSDGTGPAGSADGIVNLQPQVGQTIELKGTDKPDRIMIWVRMKDGTSLKYLDEDI